MSNKALLTILIPLHKAKAWVDIISKNIELFPPNCKIIISDQTLCDNTLEILKAKFKEDRRISFISEIATTSWRIHTNYLISKVETKYFSIMPQDDLITEGYYEKLLLAIANKKNIALSFGVIEGRNVPNEPPCIIFSSPKIDLGKLRPWQEAIILQKEWNLGIAYRGVIETKIAKPILETPNDVFADLVWVFGLALKKHLVEVKDALYIKNYHSESAHSKWKNLDNSFSKDELNKLLAREIYRSYWYNPLKIRNIRNYLLEN